MIAGFASLGPALPSRRRTPPPTLCCARAPVGAAMDALDLRGYSVVLGTASKVAAGVVRGAFRRGAVHICSGGHR